MVLGVEVPEIVADDDQWETAPPNPAALIEALRSLGYSPESAVADLIDNSITANSKRIDLIFHWSGADSWCAVVDNGRGMDEETLREAMRIASRDPLEVRAEGDLGRYGMGLKTASISQCREVTVMSRVSAKAVAHIRVWDIDHVRETGEWRLRRRASKKAASVLRHIDSGHRGTIVLWRRLDVLVDPNDSADDQAAEQRYLEHLASIEEHLAMVFERYLARTTAPVEIRLNGRQIRGWDPFLSSRDATQTIPPETLQLRGADVIVRPYVLPHGSKLTDAEYAAAGGPGGWNAQQGFYVYRKDRLIDAGDWLGLGLTRDDSHNLARISVDVPDTLDADWSLDVTKGTVRPPSALRGDLARIARLTRARAKAVLTHRGAPVGRRKKSSIVPVWRQKRRHGELVFGINREHPVVAQLLAGDGGKEFAALLDVIEETVPVPALPVNAADAERPRFDGRPPEAVIALAVALYEAELRRGLSRREAADRVSHCEPFDEYPELVGEIWGQL